MKRKPDDLNVLFDSDMQPVGALSPAEHRLRILEEKFRQSTLRILAPTRDDAIKTITAKLIRLRKQYDSWACREYVVNNKTIITRYGVTTVYEANNRRRQLNLNRLSNEINQAIRELKLLGLAEDEISGLISK